MDLFNICAGVDITTIGKITNVIQIDWIGRIIQSLIENCNSIGLGIIVFTLILKLITLPFDIISRVSTKKNSVMMEKMRPELERLQRQYANNKDLYQRKMQDLYKKNGYSPFSACLPTLLNLVFFIVVIGQFSTYSNYANFDVFCNMSVAYEDAVVNYGVEEGQAPEDHYVLIVEENGTNVKKLNLDKLFNSDYCAEFNNIGLAYNKANGYDATLTLPASFADETKENNALKVLYSILDKENSPFISTGAYYNEAGEPTVIVKNGEAYSWATSEAADVFKNTFGSTLLDYYGKKFVNENIKPAGAAAAAEKYRSYDYSFLWVKNVWSQDLPWEHPVKDSFEAYQFQVKSGCFDACSARCNGENLTIDTINQGQYEELTAGLSEEKKQPNGYLILVVLSIGTMLIQQFIAQKQNKTQNELGTVDGENGTAAQSAKMMTWMMPLMFGIFSFMYTASFSIYIVVSSIFSLLSNFVINKLVDLRFEKLAKQAVENEVLRRTGRISEIKENNKKNKNKK
ncbi:MAG: YidC/Oxa1 family membrane protein insertase [Clostridia bacterium]|nr:YidC/Oxa1 family membrane protein insertase [Clostridia bacterium]